MSASLPSAESPAEPAAEFTVSSALPPAHPPVRMSYKRRDPTAPPPRPVFSDTSPATDPASEVPSHPYSLRDRSTLLPPDRYAAASTRVSDIFEPGTYREAVQSPEWRAAMAEELDALSRTHT